MLQAINVPITGQTFVFITITALLLYCFRRSLEQSRLIAPLEGDYKLGQGANYAAANAEEVLRQAYPKVRSKLPTETEADEKSIAINSLESVTPTETQYCCLQSI